jgi:hypothetical protein
MPLFTASSGSGSTLLGRGTFAERFHVKRKTSGWEIDIKAKDATDLAVQSITFQPGGHSGWHRHPGPVFIQVKSGAMTFYESDDPTCTRVVRTAGQGYLDTGDHAHIARNESSQPAENIVVYFAPQGAALRIDKPAPGNCLFQDQRDPPCAEEGTRPFTRRFSFRLPGGLGMKQRRRLEGNPKGGSMSRE